MLHWLHSLLPHIPHYGYVLVFIVAFLNNLGFRSRAKPSCWGPDLFWGKLRIHCGSPWWPERGPVFWAAFVPSGWGGGWAGVAWKKSAGSILRPNG